MNRTNAFLIALVMLFAATAASAAAGHAPVAEPDLTLPATAPATHARALLLAQDATRAVAPAVLAPDLSSAQPSELAARLLALHGARADVAHLDAHPEVGRLLAAFLAFDAAARAGDAASVFGARLALLEAALSLRMADVATDDVVAPPALVLRFGVSDDVYAEDVALVYDVGGHDAYANNAGGNGIGRNVESCVAGVPMAAALFDFAGDDHYGAPDRGCGINGGAVTGAGFLYDEGGDDVYMGANDGVNGGGSNGIGFLQDMSGHDRYLAGGWGTNGGGYPGGYGTLVDDGAGDDVYVATHDAVNGGGVGGVGLLRDLGGRDWYDDRGGGTGWDVSVVPKEVSGLQLDE